MAGKVARARLKHRRRSSRSNASIPTTQAPTGTTVEGGLVYSANPDPSVWKLLDVEIILVVHMVVAIMTHLALQDYFVETACGVDLGLGNDVCLALKTQGGSSDYSKEEEQVQQFLGSLMMWRTILQNLLPVILVAQIGSWSDRNGRKIPMLMVVVTYVIRYIFLLLAVSAGTEAWKVGLTSAWITSLAGNNACFGMAVFSYVSDTTPPTKLTERMSITGSAFFVGITCGTLLGGFLSSQSFSYFHIFAMGLVTEVFVLVSVLLFVRDAPREGEVTPWEMFKDLFNIGHIRDSFGSAFKARPGNARTKLMLLLMSHALVLAPMYGESSVEYMAGRLMYNWDTSSYSSFLTYRTIVGFISNFVSMGILNEVLQLSDPVIGIVSCVSVAVAAIVNILFTTLSATYAAPLICILAGSMMAVPRSLILKIVPSNESGKIYSFIGSLESLVPLVSAPSYAFLYSKTMEVMPGAYYALSASLMVPPIFVYSWLYVSEKSG